MVKFEIGCHDFERFRPLLLERCGIRSAPLVASVAKCQRIVNVPVWHRNGGGTMRPNRILRLVLVALFVTLGILTRDGGGVARAEPPLTTSQEPRVVAISPLGTVNRRQTFEVLINRRSGEAIAFGYLNYIHGLNEDDLYLEGDGRLETRALFTLYIEARIARVHKIGSVVAYEVLGRSTISFDDTPDGDFSDPETFRDGIRIATGEENTVFTFDPESETGTGDVRLRQTAAWPSEFKGELIQFGEVGNHTVSWRGKTLRNNSFGWTRVFCTATTVQASPAQAVPPP